VFTLLYFPSLFFTFLGLLNEILHGSDLLTLSPSTPKAAIAGAKCSANFFGSAELAVDAASISFIALYAVHSVMCSVAKLGKRARVSGKDADVGGERGLLADVRASVGSRERDRNGADYGGCDRKWMRGKRRLCRPWRI
jgi:hypothetical protein